MPATPALADRRPLPRPPPLRALLGGVARWLPIFVGVVVQQPTALLLALAPPQAVDHIVEDHAVLDVEEVVPSLVDFSMDLVGPVGIGGDGESGAVNREPGVGRTQQERPRRFEAALIKAVEMGVAATTLGQVSPRLLAEGIVGHPPGITGLADHLHIGSPVCLASFPQLQHHGTVGAWTTPVDVRCPWEVIEMSARAGDHESGGHHMGSETVALVVVPVRPVGPVAVYFQGELLVVHWGQPAAPGTSHPARERMDGHPYPGPRVVRVLCFFHPRWSPQLGHLSALRHMPDGAEQPRLVDGFGVVDIPAADVQSVAGSSGGSGDSQPPAGFGERPGCVLAGFNRSSQHLDDGGVRWGRCGSDCAAWDGRRGLGGPSRPPPSSSTPASRLGAAALEPWATPSGVSWVYSRVSC